MRFAKSAFRQLPYIDKYMQSVFKKHQSNLLKNNHQHNNFEDDCNISYR